MLPNRKHVVITRSGLDIDDENVEVLKDISDVQKYVDDDNENFLIGGATMYALLINKVSKMYITRIKLINRRSTDTTNIIDTSHIITCHSAINKAAILS